MSRSRTALPQQSAPVSGWQVAIALAALAVAPYLGLASFTVDERIAEVWPVGGVGFVLLTTLWAAGPRIIAGATGLIGLVTLVTALGLDYSPATAVWIAVCAALQPLLAALGYRRMRGRDGWVPTGPYDVLALLVATVTASLLVGLVGGYPHLPVSDLPTVVLLWWVLRNAVFGFTGAVIFIALFHQRTTDEPLEPSAWPNRVALVPVAALCVVGTYHDPSLPLSWLLLVPAVWAGMSMTLRGTAYVLLLVALTAAGLTYLPQNQFGYEGWLPAASIVDLLITAATGFATLLVLMRQQRAHLIVELGDRGREAESQRALLATVVDAMTEGVLLVDEGGLSTHNAAARQLLGRPIPRAAGRDWIEGLGLTQPDGRPVGAHELQALLAAPPSGAVELRVGSGPDSRVLELVTKHVGGPAGEPADGATDTSDTANSDDGADGTSGRARVLLLRDITAERARVRELTDFAGHVAHDLRGPLTVLDGWLEVAFDDDSGPDDVAGAAARAHEASQRMRQVIEDWLGYTVVQQGQLRPEPVPLADVAQALVESRIAGDDDTRPLITLDLPHTVLADPALLRQLLDNLVDNAVKYTEPGRRPVVTLRSREDEEAGWVRVEVADEGMGVPEGQEEAIFGEFRTGPTQGRSQGTGLGLSLTRRIVAMHGGAITARRNPGRGSTFSFTLPRA